MELSKDIIEAIAEKTLEKFLAGPFGELRDGQKALAARIEKLDARFDCFDARLDRMDLRIDQLTAEVIKNSERISSLETQLNLRIDALGARLDARIDEMGARLGARIDEVVREQARLAEAVTALKTDKSVTADVLHRLTRVEDKLYA